MAEPIKRRGEKPVAVVPSKPLPKGTDLKHPAGIFADMATDGPLIGTLVAVVDKAKNLPNLKSIGKQDPYCVLRLGKHVKRTEPDKRGGQTPKWDAELRFPVHDSGDYRHLKIVIFTDDKKTELIGECIVSLDNILDTSGGGQSDGWHQCKCRGKYAGDIRVELTFWDERPRETAPLQVNTRQVTAFEKEDYLKRPEKPLSGPRRPGVPARSRELPERPNPKPSKEELVPSSPEEEEPPEPPVAQHRKDRDRRDREPRERQREERRHREYKREKSRHHREGERDGERERERRREKSRPPPDMYDHDPYRQHQPQHHPPPHPQHGMSYEQEQYGGYNQPSQVATLQDFQSEHIGKLQAQYVEQTQLIPHQRHSPNPAAYSGYQNDIYDQHPNHNGNAMVLANQSGPPMIPQHRHVEFADTRRAVIPASSQPPPPPPQGLHHRKSRSEFYPNSGSDMYQTGSSYNNQLVSASSFAPTPPRHHGYDQPLQQPPQQPPQQYQEQSSYASQGFDQPLIASIPQPKPPLQPLQQPSQQLSQQPLQYQSNSYQSTYQDPYAEQSYQSQLVRASEYAPPPLPQHSQAAAYRTVPTPQNDYANSSSLVLAHSSAAPPPPLPSHRVAQPRMSMPASMPANIPPAPISQSLTPLQQSIPPQQPIDSYEQSFQLQSVRGYAAPPPPPPAHGGSQFKPTPSPQPIQLQQPVQQPVQQSVQDPSMQSRIRGNSEPPPYAAITDSGGFNQGPEPQRTYDQNGYNTHQSYSSGYAAPPGSTAYTSYTDYSKRINMPQNPEHAFDPTTALVLAGGGPPPLPSHSGAQPSHRGRPNVAPISTNAPPKKALSRSPSPHPLALTPGYGPDSPGDDIHQSSFTQLPEPLSQYRAADNSIDSSRPLMQQNSQPIDATNRRRSVSPMPPPPSMNNYSQELVSSRGGPPPLPSASHRMPQNLVYKHDPSENPSESRSNRSSAYDYAHIKSQNNINGILDFTYQSASTSYVDDPPSREYMTSSASPHPSSYDHAKRPPSRNPSPYPNYGAEGNRATSPMPPARRNSDLPPRRTPEPERQPSTRPEHRRMTLGGMPFSPDDYDVINPVGLGSSPGNRSPSGNISTMPLARSPGAVSISPGQYMTAKEEKKMREEEKKAAKKARKKVFTPNSANRELEADDILAPDTYAPEPLRRNSFNAGNNGGGAATPGPEGGDDRGREDKQPLSFRPRRQSVSPAPPPSDIYGSSPGRGFMRSNGASTPSSGYGYAAAPTPTHSGGGHRPLPGAPVMRNAIMGPDDYYQQQQQQGYGGGGAAPPMRAPQQPNQGGMTQEQWSLSQELSSISIGTSSSRRPRTGTWA
ncbi:uncharacterized protein DFL_009417 [Arthrobotrys flagrans]|uniref:C2 domain-containing protein n=1 Tax=Arthrobotrys flagrans TaxID=97331 RepID=A0A436ZRK2_ARTFL|nr:hypothetical protein DFL_009417 [Arthrobotrys flagrans]